MSQPLSPAAQAVRQAAINAEPGQTISAALRAAADQVVPHPVHPSAYRDCCEYSCMQTRVGIRAELLAIAAELEGGHD